MIIVIWRPHRMPYTDVHIYVYIYIYIYIYTVYAHVKIQPICIDTRQTHANTLIIPSYIHKCFRTSTISFINRNFRTHTVETITSTQCRYCDIPNMQHDIHFPPNESDDSLLSRSGYGRSAWRSEDCAAGRSIFIESGWWFSSHMCLCRTIHQMEIKIQS